MAEIKKDPNNQVRTPFTGEYLYYIPGEHSYDYNRLCLPPLEYVPDTVRNRKICEVAISQPKWIPPPLIEGHEAAAAAILRGERLWRIAVAYRTHAICLAAVRNEAGDLGDVPDSILDLEICLETVRINGYPHRYVPDRFRTLEFYIAAADIVGAKIMRYTPDRFYTRDFYKAIVRKNGMDLARVPNKFRDDFMHWIAIRQNVNAIDIIRKDKRTREVYEIMVQQDGMLLGKVPARYINHRMCLFAVQQNRNAFNLVPEELQSPEIYILAAII